MSTPQDYLRYKAKPGNREKLTARWQCSDAIRRGDLVRRPCEVCAAEKADAHHDDYSKPLEVRWLCKKCHGMAHRKPKETCASRPCTRARPAFCRRGHEMVGHNVIVAVEQGSERHRCRACKADGARARDQRRNGRGAR